MTVRDRAWLRTNILRVLEAEYDPEAVANADTWLDAGLEDCYANIRAWWMQRAALLTINDDGVVILPPSYIGMVALFPQTGGKPLEAITPEQAGPKFADSGCAKYYLIEGFTLTLLPLQATGTMWRATYWSKDFPLENDTDTTAILVNAPMAAVYAGARHGDVFAGADPSASRHDAAFQAQVQQINGNALRGRLGSGYTVRRG